MSNMVKCNSCGKIFHTDGREEQDYIDALSSIIVYNGLGNYILSWMKLRPQQNSFGLEIPSISPPENYGAESPEDISQLQIIWMIAVMLFGNFGTSPRYGWIDEIEEFERWILNITDDYRRSPDYDGPEKYRITLKEQAITKDDIIATLQSLESTSTGLTITAELTEKGRQWMAKINEA